MSSVRSTLLCLLLLALAPTLGCLQKGDTEIDVGAGGSGAGPAPSCTEVCGRITANDPNWLTCMDVAPKDRDACRDRCEALDAGEEALRCAMASHDCTELQECGPVY